MPNALLLTSCAGFDWNLGTEVNIYGRLYTDLYAASQNANKDIEDISDDSREILRYSNIFLSSTSCSFRGRGGNLYLKVDIMLMQKKSRKGTSGVSSVCDLLA